MESKDEPLFIPLFIGVALLVGLLPLYALTGGIEPRLTFDKVDKSNDLEENSEVVSIDGDEVEIRGNIIGETGGQTVVAEKKSYHDGELVINVRTEHRGDKDSYIEVLRGYKYEITIENLEENDIILVNHDNGKDFRLDIDRTNGAESDNVEDAENLEGVTESGTAETVTAEITNYESSASDKQNEYINAEDIVVDGDDNIVQVTGSMVGNTGSQKPIVDSIETEDDTVIVNFALEKPKGFATQVITKYEYSATVESVGNYKRVVVNQEEGQSDTLDLN